MLHSALPRSYLAPGMSYLGAYFGREELHPYGAAYHSLEAPYVPRLADHQLFSWEAARAIQRPVTPSPLDLSLKPPPTPCTPARTEESDASEHSEPIEVDDEEDYSSRNVERYTTQDQDVVVDDEVSAENFTKMSSGHVPYQDVGQDLRPPYSGRSLTQKYTQLHNQKLRLSSPPHLQTYHQQLLLTPQHHMQSIHAPMTPPSTPSPPQCPRKRARDDDASSPTLQSPPAKQAASEKSRPKKKHARRLKFDEDTSSPVSGTVILSPDEAVVTGDIDPAFNIVEVTEEARAELAKIENRLGPYQCKLCRQLHEDAFQLAQHRCSRIAHVEYRCPECDKRFSCPANLASHRRWHKPRLPLGDSSTSTSNSEVSCTRCDAKFTRQAALRKHMASQHSDVSNHGDDSNSTTNNNNEDDVSDGNTNVQEHPDKTLIPGSIRLGNRNLGLEMP